MHLHHPSKKDIQSALKLSATLGGLPLALSQISGYLSTIEYSIDEFLDMYEEPEQNSDKLLLTMNSESFDYEHTLNTVWDLTLSNLSPTAESLLRVLAFLDPDNIPESLLSGPKIPQATVRASFPDAKPRYVSFSLCTFPFHK